MKRGRRGKKGERRKGMKKERRGLSGGRRG